MSQKLVDQDLIELFQDLPNTLFNRVDVLEATRKYYDVDYEAIAMLLNKLIEDHIVTLVEPDFYKFNKKS